MNIKVKDLINTNDIKNKIKNAVNGMDYRTTYLIEFGSDCKAKVTEIDIVYNEDLEIIVRK